MKTYRDSPRFQRGVMYDDTGMDPENALTAIKPEETRCGSITVAEGAAGETVGADEETK